jgi:parvulin-like peptidyl-prolyl isomerase
MLMSGCGKKAQDEGAAITPEPTAPSIAPAPQAGHLDMEATLVTVEGESLTRGMAMGMAREMAARQGVPPQMLEQFLSQMGGQFEKQAIDQFISQTLVSKEATRRDIPVSDEEVDAVLANVGGTLPEGMTLEQALQAQNMTVADFRENIVANEQMRKLFEAETTEAEEVTGAQVETFYTENAQHFTTEESATASHILITCDEKADEEAHAKAKADLEAIKVTLAEGGDFAELAKEHSSCPSKEQGGSLGSFTRGRMVPEFEEAAFSMELGTVSDVVKTQFGYHLITVTERTEASSRPLEEVSEEIRTHLDREAEGKLFEVFVDGLKEGAEITYPKTDA